MLCLNSLDIFYGVLSCFCLIVFGLISWHFIRNIYRSVEVFCETLFYSNSTLLTFVVQKKVINANAKKKKKGAFGCERSARRTVFHVYIAARVTETNGVTCSSSSSALNALWMCHESQSDRSFVRRTDGRQRQLKTEEEKCVCICLFNTHLCVVSLRPCCFATVSLSDASLCPLSSAKPGGRQTLQECVNPLFTAPTCDVE